jgi:dihydroxy-acid dehydratase
MTDIEEIGYRIRLSVKARTIDLLVDAAELQRRAAEFKAPPRAGRGYAKLYQQHVLQADAGCDFDFLRAQSSNMEA